MPFQEEGFGSWLGLRGKQRAAATRSRAFVSLAHFGPGMRPRGRRHGGRVDCPLSRTERAQYG